MNGGCDYSVLFLPLYRPEIQGDGAEQNRGSNLALIIPLPPMPPLTELKQAELLSTESGKTLPRVTSLFPSSKRNYRPGQMSLL